MMRSRIMTAALVGSAFAAAALGTTILNAATESSDRPARTQSVDTRLSAHFSVLRQKAETDSAARASQAGVLMADTGVNPELTRAAGRIGTDTILVSPSRSGLCIGTKALGVLTCGDTDDALNGTVIGAVICSRHVPADKVEVLGTFPDEVTEVKAKLSDGSTTTYPVQSNVFARQFDKSAPVPLTFAFSANGANRQVVTSVPPKDDLGCGG